jgi:hypothetical protein
MLLQNDSKEKSRYWIFKKADASTLMYRKQPVLVFCHYDKITEKNNLREERFISEVSFDGWFSLLACCKAENITMGGHGGGKLLAPWHQEAVRGRKGPGTRYTLRRHAPSNLLPSTELTS